MARASRLEPLHFLLFTFPPTYSNSPNYTLRLEGTIRVVETALSAGIG